MNQQPTPDMRPRQQAEWQHVTENVAFARRIGGVAIRDFERTLDMDRMCTYRLRRFQEQLVANDCAGAILFGSFNARYVTGTKTQAYNLHNPYRAIFVAPEGLAISFDWAGMDLDGLPVTIGERRDAKIATYFPSGEHGQSRAVEFAKEVAGLLRESSGGSNMRMALDLAEPSVTLALIDEGIELVGAEKLIEHAAVIKNQDELYCLAYTASLGEAGLARIRENLRPGISEIKLWSELNRVNIEAEGESFEYRLLSSGGRTNPWGQEASEKLIRAGELVGCDTGMIGPYGYGADISRTFYCGPGRPSDEQRRLYAHGLDNLRHNLSLVKAGVSFEELSKNSWLAPEEFRANRYNGVYHGLGMGDEWPSIPLPDHWDEEGYEGELKENMVICVESTTGREDGVECVRLEETVVVTENGYQLLSTFPFEEDLM